MHASGNNMQLRRIPILGTAVRDNISIDKRRIRVSLPILIDGGDSVKTIASLASRGRLHRIL